MVESKIQNLENSKDKILAFLKLNGPTIPIKISTHLGVDTILASALLADLLSDKEIKMSYMKVGNSPIYFLKGHEEKLQNFSNYLGGKEREAFELLKEKKILRDSNQEPAIRVALRSLKDFAHGFSVRDELFWRYYLVGQEEATGKVESKIDIVPNKEIDKVPEKKVSVIEKVKQVFIGEDKKEEKPIIQKMEEKEESADNNLGSLKEIEKKNTSLSFVTQVENYLNDSKFQIVRKITEKKKDYVSIIRLRNKEEIKDYLCICKDKKSLTENDVMKFLEEGKKEKLPVFAISSGDPNKKAQEWIDYLEGSFVFRKLN